MNTVSQDFELIEHELQKNKVSNEININTIKTFKNKLFLLENTKAWKMMCLLRRVNEQFIKGDATERKKFVSWVQKKILKKPIPSENALIRYSPIQSEKIEPYELKETKSVSERPLYTPRMEKQGDYITFNKPKSYDIFRFPVINWNFRWQRPQQISKQFAESGHRVFYFSVDVTPLGKDNLSYAEVADNVSIIEVENNVWVIRLCTKNNMSVYKDRIEDQQDHLYLKWSLKYVQEKFNVGFSISIIDLPFWQPLMKDISFNLVVYDCMDDHEGFSTNSKTMLIDEKNLMSSADLVIASSQRLFEKINTSNENTVLIRNAGEYNHFSSVTEELLEPLASGPVIGYYGAISEWFDIELICKLAKKHSEWTFILIGDTFGCDITNAEKISNIIFYGEMPYQNLPKYLAKFDVALIPFIKNNLTLATNPVKVYEYLAAGKPVVSTGLPELQLIKEYLYLADTFEEFDQAIMSALKENRNESMDKRKKFALQNTWHSRYLTLNEEINSRFFPKVSIVIVTYNNWSFTKQCLNSLLYTNDYPNLEVIVVDNMSTDETRIELARLMHPQLKIILSPYNTGFAGGNSIGCKESTGDFIVLLNNDTILSPGWIHRLIKPLADREDVGMAGPVSNSVGNDQILDFFQGDPITGADKLWLREFHELYEGKYYETDLLGFYCVAIKREVYNQLGDLDKSYGVGMFEDDDYCEQVKALGYKLIVVQDAFVYHHGSASFKKMDSTVYNEIWEKNKQYFEQKWNRKWVNPKGPHSYFSNCYDAESVSKALKLAGKPVALILGAKKWSSHNYLSGSEVLSKTLSDMGYLAIVYIHHYNDNAITGVRKLSESIYVTNRLDLFFNAEFDSVIYCGETEYYPLKSKTIYIDSASYHDKDFFGKFTKENSFSVYDSGEKMVPELRGHL
ncbi:glycosyltransferase [Paenibacillus camerounensis]|uniref:glycosyltransferase n=1 Tax=Paenibacillus camerounensis TaxID=1243663 RepID=UPI0006942808|nr:glycosyltransferase [Paenibacillus camerounensis]